LFRLNRTKVKRRADTRHPWHVTPNFLSVNPPLVFRFGFPHLQDGAAVHLIFGDKLDSHAPTSIGSEQLPELLQRQCLFIDLNDCLVVLIVVDQIKLGCGTGRILPDRLKVSPAELGISFQERFRAFAGC